MVVGSAVFVFESEVGLYPSGLYQWGCGSFFLLSTVHIPEKKGGRIWAAVHILVTGGLVIGDTAHILVMEESAFGIFIGKHRKNQRRGNVLIVGTRTKGND